jgi:nicotinate-nucleotide adenylyltransferase
MRLIGILGGTFDPIHNGHIRLAVEVLEKLKLDEVKLIPANIPPHRPTPFASPADRKRMIKLAISDEKKISIDLREIENRNISYAVNTLKSLRDEFSNDILFLIIGVDVFNMIDGWKEWRSLLNYTHIIVAARSSNNKENISSVLRKWINENKIDDINLLTSVLSGYIYYIDTPIVEISSSMIRTYYTKHKNIEEYLPSNVITYIKENNLYKNN